MSHRQAGIPYRIDLCNEAVPQAPVPGSNQQALLDYTQKLWNAYIHDFGRNDTCGFSTIGVGERIAFIPQVYGSNPPYLFDFHFYRSSAVFDEGAMFTAAHKQMNELGYTNQGWTIGEVYYNDPTAARKLRQAIDSTGRTVFYLLQWPVVAPTVDQFPKPCADVSVAPPVNFSAYAAQGF